MKKPIPPLDIDAIRMRLAASNPFGVPRWVASDVAHLLAEVVKLRAEAREHPEHRDGIDHRRIADEARVEAEKKINALQAENAELRATVEELRAWLADAAPLVVELTRDQARIIGWLRGFASMPSRGPVSPVRRTEQLFAAYVAGVIERGEHRTPAGDEA